MQALATRLPIQAMDLRRMLLAQSSVPTRLWITQEAAHLASLPDLGLWKFELDRALSWKLAGRFRPGSSAAATAGYVLEFLVLTEVEENRQSAQSAFQAADQRTNQLMNILATILKTSDQERGTINKALN